MKKKALTNLITTYAAPVGAILGGLVLLFSPDTATALIAKVLSIGLILGGICCGLTAVFNENKRIKHIAAAAVLLLVGRWLYRSPMSLAAGFGKLLGLGLLAGAVSGFRKSVSRSGRTVYLAEGLVGLVLLAAPMTASRAVYTVVGLALLAAGVVMLMNRLKKRDRLDSGSGNIIDI